MTIDAFRGDLLLDGEIVHQGIDFWIEVIPATPPAPPYEWCGSFNVGAVEDFDAIPVYDLQLDDGRCGKLLVTRCDGDSYIFQGSEDLK